MNSLLSKQQKNQYKYSVLISTFNRKELLRECLNAVFSQIEKPDEVIVSDDASCDGTDIFLTEYAKTHSLVVYIQKKNLNMIGNKNFLAERATGDILCFIDDDFIVDKGWLFYIKKSFIKDPLLVITGGKTIQQIYRAEEKIFFFPMHVLEIIRTFFKKYLHIAIPYFFTKTENKSTGGVLVVRGNNMAIRRDFFIKRFEQLVDVGEDTVLCLEAQRAGGHVAYVPDAYGYEKTGIRSGFTGGHCFFYRIVRNWVYIHRFYRLHQGFIGTVFFYTMFAWTCVVSVFFSFKHIEYIKGIRAFFDGMKMASRL